MWKEVADKSGALLNVNLEQIVAINEDENKEAILMMSDGSSILTKIKRDKLVQEWGLGRM